MESPGKRLRWAFAIPLGVLAFMAVVIGGLGILLLYLAEVKPEMGGVKEPLSIVVAILIALAILAGGALLSLKRRQHEE